MKNKNILYGNKGVTLTDVIIGIVILTLFAGVISQLMYNIYNQSIEIQASAHANAYATIILEKVDEKSYEEIDGQNFITKLFNKGEIEVDGKYALEFTVEPLEGFDKDIIKKIILKIKYNVNGQEKEITMSKLKIKEI